MNGGEDYLDALADTLDQIGERLSRGRDHYHSAADVRLAIQRLWIAAGECARRYCNATGTGVGEEPWSSLWGYRNFLAHQLPDRIDDDRVWVETSRDIAEYRSAVEALRSVE